MPRGLRGLVRVVRVVLRDQGTEGKQPCAAPVGARRALVSGRPGGLGAIALRPSEIERQRAKEKASATKCTIWMHKAARAARTSADQHG